MSHYQLIALSSAKPGLEQVFQAWYNDEHIPDILQVPGIHSAQVSVVAATMGPLPWQLITIYDVETEDPDAIIAELQKRIGAGTMRISDSVDMTTVSLFVAAPR